MLQAVSPLFHAQLVSRACSTVLQAALAAACARSGRSVGRTQRLFQRSRRAQSEKLDDRARATAKTQAHASSAKDQDRHLMMTELMLDICKYDQCLCWLAADNVIPLHRHVNVGVRQNSNAQDCVNKTIRDPFTTQFTPTPRGKIAYLAASFRHIDACARGEIPIVAAPPPFPTRDFLPWRFSAAGRQSAWRDHHSGGRKPTHKRSLASLLDRAFTLEISSCEDFLAEALGFLNVENGFSLAIFFESSANGIERIVAMGWLATFIEQGDTGRVFLGSAPKGMVCPRGSFPSTPHEGQRRPPPAGPSLSRARRGSQARRPNWFR